jgi:hypothetical protein
VFAAGRGFMAGHVLRGSGRPGGECRECFAAPAPGFRGQAPGGAALVFLLPGVPGLQDALVADDEQAGDGEHEGGQAREAAPAAGYVVAGGVFGGGEAAFGAGAAGVGAAVRGGGVVVFLCGFGGDLGRDGEGLLGAAGGRSSP